jgi:hypothetical protein
VNSAGLKTRRNDGDEYEEVISERTLRNLQCSHTQTGDGSVAYADCLLPILRVIDEQISEDLGDDCMTITVRYTRNGKRLKATIQADKWRGMSTAMDSGETIEWELVPVSSARGFKIQRACA